MPHYIHSDAATTLFAGLVAFSLDSIVDLTGRIVVTSACLISTWITWRRYCREEEEKQGRHSGK